MSTFYNLPATGSEVTLLTHLSCARTRTALRLCDARSARAFRQLLRISGVGARTALAVLSGMSVADLREAVTRQEAGG